MWTTTLAYLIAFMGFITFAGGAFGLLILMFEEVAKTGRVPLRYYALMVAGSTRLAASRALRGPLPGFAASALILTASILAHRP
jgi:hypothetical protein